ncbi:MAG TPA: hypothetical protein VLA32_11210 [Anaerolineales bacterium]|jgi:hypothetical protein|nr:hypothetical protein [Anaerolineales bacterium]
MPAIGWAGPNLNADQLEEQRSFAYTIHDPNPKVLDDFSQKNEQGERRSFEQIPQRAERKEI